MTTSKVTTDHEEIRKWVESRKGRPAHVVRTGRDKQDLGILRIDFPGWTGEDTLEHVDWDRWFDAFDANQLAFLYQEKTADGEQSRFNKLVSRESKE
jgi:hypothetical protein